MANETIILLWTALSIGFFHTLIGPDHYVPFVMMAKARNWSLFKTNIITLLCGIGHVLSSIILGFIGVAFGIAVSKLEGVESMRAEIAVWLLIAFGFAYFVWGVKEAIRNRPHRHFHEHSSVNEHEHSHSHNVEHLHVHEGDSKKNITPWVLFTIFVFGPCEPLIPILMYPAAKNDLSAVILVAAVFGAATISTMLILVSVFSFGLSKLPLAWLNRYSHAMAGFAILLCGVAVKFLGL